MKTIKEKNRPIATFLAFALIPLSGFATDIYIPSLPAMATQLHVSTAAVQLSLIVFLISSGISQLFVGSLLDSYGRYNPGRLALVAFILASFAIAVSHHILLVYVMRVIQGIAVAAIVVGKRAYFIDTYSGEKLKHYTSLFSIVWAAAPIIAPFLGGFLQDNFGWQANFYFLGFFTLAILMLELIYGGESLKYFQPFKAGTIFHIYRETFRTVDYTLGLIIISLAYAMLIVYGLTSPFVIEHVFQRSPVVTGFSSLFSGMALMSGGIISKLLIRKPLVGKLTIAILLQVLFAATMMLSGLYKANLWTFVAFTLAVHFLSGFIFNNAFAYCLGRFSKNAGIVSGITGGALFIVTSIISYGIVNVLEIRDQHMLGMAYLIFAGLAVIVLFLFSQARKTSEEMTEAGRYINSILVKK
ncbi:MFS transporter [Mucilaginibacter rigui]|nr:MFS transporter [Mucilaginibacter rigui]